MGADVVGTVRVVLSAGLLARGAGLVLGAVVAAAAAEDSSDMRPGVRFSGSYGEEI